MNVVVSVAQGGSALVLSSAPLSCSRCRRMTALFRFVFVTQPTPHNEVLCIDCDESTP